MKRKIKCVITAAGKGTRMKSDIPKVLHQVRGKAMLDHVVDAVKALGISDIAVIVGHKKEEFEYLKSQNIELVEQKELLGSGHAVMQTQKVCKGFDDVLVLCGDVPLITPDTLKSLLKTHLAKENKATVLSGKMENPCGYGRIIRDNNGAVKLIREQKDASAEEAAVCEINSGMYCFDVTELFKALKKVTPKNAQKEYYLTDVIEIMYKAKKNTGAFITNDISEIAGINNRMELSAADSAMSARIVEQLSAEGVTIYGADTVFINKDAKIGKDSIIYPYTFIDSKVVIGKNCKVGPFAHIRQGTVLKDRAEIGNFVEVKQSIIGSGTKAKHLSYIGNAEIGKKVNIGAGTITANYDGKNKHKTVIGDGAFIGSDSKLVAPVKIGKNAVTGAGCVVTKDVPANSVVVGVPAKKIR